MVTITKVRHPAVRRKGSVRTREELSPMHAAASNLNASQQIVRFDPQQPKEPHITIHETLPHTGASNVLHVHAPASGVHYTRYHKGTSSSQATQDGSHQTSPSATSGTRHRMHQYRRDTEQVIVSSPSERGSVSLYKKHGIPPTPHPAASEGFFDDSDDESGQHQRGRRRDPSKVQDVVEDLPSNQQQKYHKSSMKHGYPTTGSRTYGNHGPDPEDLPAHGHSSRSRLRQADTLRTQDSKRIHSSSYQPQYGRSSTERVYPPGSFGPEHPLAYGHSSTVHLHPPPSIMQYSSRIEHYPGGLSMRVDNILEAIPEHSAEGPMRIYGVQASQVIYMNNRSDAPTSWLQPGPYTSNGGATRSNARSSRSDRRNH